MLEQPRLERDHHRSALPLPVGGARSRIAGHGGARRRSGRAPGDRAGDPGGLRPLARGGHRGLHRLRARHGAHPAGVGRALRSRWRAAGDRRRPCGRLARDVRRRGRGWLHGAARLDGAGRHAQLERGGGQRPGGVRVVPARRARPRAGAAPDGGPGGRRARVVHAAAARVRRRGGCGPLRARGHDAGGGRCGPGMAARRPADRIRRAAGSRRRARPAHLAPERRVFADDHRAGGRHVAARALPVQRARLERRACGPGPRRGSARRRGGARLGGPLVRCAWRADRAVPAPRHAGRGAAARGLVLGPLGVF